MKNMSEKNLDVIAAIEAGDEKLLQDYICKIVELEKQCRDAEDSLNASDNACRISAKVSYQIECTLSLRQREFKCNSFSEIFFVLMVAAIHYQQDKLVPLLLAHIKPKDVSDRQVKTLLFGIISVSISNKDKQESLNNIFRSLLEVFAPKIVDDNVFDLVLYTVRYKLIGLLRSLLDLCMMLSNHSNILDRLKTLEQIFDMDRSLDLEKYLFSAKFLSWEGSGYGFLNPLHMATIKSDIEIATALLAVGANNSLSRSVDVMSYVIHHNDSKMLAIFLRHGFGVFETFEKSQLQMALKQNIGKILLLGCDIIDNGRLLKSKEFKYPDVITTIDQLKRIPVNSAEDVYLFKRWYVSIGYTQAIIDKDITDLKKQRELWEEAKQFKFEIMQSIYRRSSLASLLTHCLFAIKHDIFEKKAMQKLKKVPPEILQKLSQFHHANSESAKKQFFRSLWNDYMANCGGEIIGKLDAYLENLFAGRDKHAKDVQKFIYEVYNSYRAEIKAAIFNEIILVQLKLKLLENIKKNPADRDQQLFVKTLATLKVSAPRFDEFTDRVKTEMENAWVKNLSELLENPVNYHLLYFLARESDLIDFKNIRISPFIDKFFKLVLQAEEIDFSNKIILFFNEKVRNALTIDQIQRELKSFEENFNDHYNFRQENTPR